MSAPPVKRPPIDLEDDDDDDDVPVAKNGSQSVSGVRATAVVRNGELDVCCQMASKEIAHLRAAREKLNIHADESGELRLPTDGDQASQFGVDQVWHNDARRRRKACETAIRQVDEWSPAVDELRNAATRLAATLIPLKFMFNESREEMLKLVPADVMSVLDTLDGPKCLVKATTRIVEQLSAKLSLLRAVAYVTKTDDIPQLSDAFYVICAPRRAFDVSPLPAWPRVALPLRGVSWFAQDAVEQLQNDDFRTYLGTFCFLFAFSSIANTHLLVSTQRVVSVCSTCQLGS